MPSAGGESSGARCMQSRSCSRTISTLATKCRLPPARWLSWARRRFRTRRVPPSCGEPAPSSSARPRSARGPTGEDRRLPVAGAAVGLGITASQTPDPRDPATFANRNKVFSDYTQFLDPDGLKGARIGVMRNGVTGGSAKTDAIYDTVIQAMSDAGATIVDPADIPTITDIIAFGSEFVVLTYDFLRDLNAYLATRVGVPIRTLADAIAFNEANADEELQYFGQELFLLAQSDPFTQADYQAALADERMIGGPQGIDAALQQFGVDALVSPTAWPAWTTDLINGDHF